MYKQILPDVAAWSASGCASLPSPFPAQPVPPQRRRCIGGRTVAVESKTFGPITRPRLCSEPGVTTPVPVQETNARRRSRPGEKKKKGSGIPKRCRYFFGDDSLFLHPHPGQRASCTHMLHFGCEERVAAVGKEGGGVPLSFFFFFFFLSLSHSLSRSVR